MALSTISMQSKKVRQSAGPVLIADAEEFQRKFCRTPFSFRHTLADSGMFSLASLAEGTEVLMSAGKGHRVLVRDAQSGVSTRFSDIRERPTTSDMFEQLETRNAWVRINNFADVNHHYADLIDTVVEEILTLTGQRSAMDVTRAQFSIFVASPHSVTPFHIDHETNFLCQISGQKDVCVYPPDDRDVLSEREIESFYSGKINAASYRPELDSHGTVFDLKAGLAVHHPPLSPHWVKNGPEVSVSVSINLCMKHLDDRAHIYQVNHLMRKVGLSPTPPGKSRTSDYLKARTMSAIGMSRPESTSDIVFSAFRRVLAPVHLARKVTSRLGSSLIRS
jgi:hypothetical protein